MCGKDEQLVVLASMATVISVDYIYAFGFM